MKNTCRNFHLEGLKDVYIRRGSIKIGTQDFGGLEAYEAKQDMSSAYIIAIPLCEAKRGVNYTWEEFE